MRRHQILDLCTGLTCNAAAERRAEQLRNHETNDQRQREESGNLAIIAKPVGENRVIAVVTNVLESNKIP